MSNIKYVINTFILVLLLSCEEGSLIIEIEKHEVVTIKELVDEYTFKGGRLNEMAYNGFSATLIKGIVASFEAVEKQMPKKFEDLIAFKCYTLTKYYLIVLFKYFQIDFFTMILIKNFSL